MKSNFQFISTAFNCTVTREYFINQESFGDDLAAWMIARLNEKGFETSPKPEQEDFGWYFNFKINGVEHCVVVGFQPNDPEKGDCWIGWVERSVGFFGSILGGRNRGVLSEAITLIDEILNSEPQIRDLSWNLKDD